MWCQPTVTYIFIYTFQETQFILYPLINIWGKLLFSIKVNIIEFISYYLVAFNDFLFCGILYKIIS